VRDTRLHLTDSTRLRLLMEWAPGGPMNVRDLAGSAQVSKTKISNLCRGGPYPTVTEETASRIAKVLGVDRRILFLASSSTSTDTDAKGDDPS
jgi:plasmid maintenance system antidote protein VapI